MVRGRGIGPLGDPAAARALALTQSDRACPRAAVDHEPTSRVRGMRLEGFDSPTKRLRTRFPGAHRGHGLRHAINTLPGQLTASAAPVRQAWRAAFHPGRARARQRQG